MTFEAVKPIEKIKLRKKGWERVLDFRGVWEGRIYVYYKNIYGLPDPPPKLRFILSNQIAVKLPHLSTLTDGGMLVALQDFAPSCVCHRLVL